MHIKAALLHIYNDLIHVICFSDRIIYIEVKREKRYLRGLYTMRQEIGFDFAQKPLRYKVMDGISGLMNNKKSSKKLSSDFDKIIYFKTESTKGQFEDTKYLVFYTDGGVVTPDLSPKQLKEVISAQKGYIGFKQEVDKLRGIVHSYTVKRLERAHSYPCEINLELLIANNAVLAV